MIKVWTSNEKGDDKLIAFANNTIYKGYPKTEQETIEMARDLQSVISQHTKLMEIPVAYCTEIRQQEGKKCIEVIYGKNVEELQIKDDFNRSQLFDYFKKNIPSAELAVEKYKPLRAGKKPMIAFFVVLGLFLWTLFYAIQGESGTIYYMEDSYFSLTGIAVGLASIGVTKVIILFSSLLAIALFAFIKKAKNPPVFNRLIIKK